MPATQLRSDPLTGRLAIVAAGRSARPHTVERASPEHDSGPEHCPFCPGHESMTPPEVMRTGSGEPGGPGWHVRVFPNLYPIVGGPGAHDGTTGAHELIVLSPDHDRSFGSLDSDEAVEVVSVLRDRVALHLGAGHAYAIALMNHRRAAGASIAHPHAQVLAIDFVPPEVHAADERARAATRDLLERDLTCAREHDTVLVDGIVAAWCPYGAGSPYLVRVACPTAGSRFDEAPDELVAEFALRLRDTLAQLGALLEDPPYNVAVHTAAADGTGPRHWYAEITPRLSVIAGFEQATGILVNTTPPERAAAALRDADA